MTQWVLGFEDWAKSIFKNSAVLANWEEALAQNDRFGPFKINDWIENKSERNEINQHEL